MFDTSVDLCPDLIYFFVSQFGLFHTHNGTQFYIEPQRGGVSDGVETDTKPHVIYTSGPPPDPSAQPSARGCGITGRSNKFIAHFC